MWLSKFGRGINGVGVIADLCRLVEESFGMDGQSPETLPFLIANGNWAEGQQ